MKKIIKKECPECGTTVEFETDTMIQQIIDDGIKKGISNKSEQITQEEIKEAVKPLLKAQTVAQDKEIKNLKIFFKDQMNEKENKHQEALKLMADKHRKDMERMQKGGSAIADIGKQKSYDEGRLQEEDIETLLKNEYQSLGDSIEPVPDGEKGADVIHTVFCEENKVGKIVVESKKTIRYKKEYETKLLNDMKNAHGNFGILVTKTMPAKIKVPIIQKFNGNMLIIKKDFLYTTFKVLHQAKRDLLILKYKNKSISSKDLNKEMIELVDKLNGPEMTNVFTQFNQDLKDLMETLVDDYKNREKHFNKIKSLIINLKNSLREQVEVFRSSPAITSKELKKIEVEKIGFDLE